MINKHLNFETLSDLIDNELTEIERNTCMAHITVCEICGREYEALTRYISLLSTVKSECVIVPDFADRTLMICRSRERKRLFIKAFPAIAASVIIVAGAGFLKSGLYNGSNRAYMATTLTGHNETQRIIESISKTNGRIIQISHSHIDGEFDKESLDTVEKILHRNNIKHAVLLNTGMVPVQSSGNIEDVSYSYGSAVPVSGRQNHAVIDNGKVRLRIFK